MTHLYHCVKYRFNDMIQNESAILFSLRIILDFWAVTVILTQIDTAYLT